MLGNSARDLLNIRFLFVDDRHVGYRIDKPPEIKHKFFIDDIESCVWVKGDRGISYYPYESFSTITWSETNENNDPGKTRGTTKAPG